MDDSRHREAAVDSISGTQGPRIRRIGIDFVRVATWFGEEPRWLGHKLGIAGVGDVILPHIAVQPVGKEQETVVGGVTGRPRGAACSGKRRSL